MFRADIQGLRALSVIAVVAFHAWPGLVPGGYVGVDVFFVISGYLITGIIVKECERRAFSVANFYRRRIRRIFPALFVVLASCLLAGFLLFPPQEYIELSRTVLSSTLFLSNIDFWSLTGYFDGPAELKPLLHTWSLAVEEQFYLLYPPFLFLLLRRFGAKRAVIALSVLCAGSLVLSEWSAHQAPAAAFFLSPARAFELLIGALLATGLRRPPARRALREGLSAAGLIAVLGAMAFYDRATPFPGLAALLPCLGAALVIYAGQGGPSRAGALLAIPPLVAIGGVSYSLYLWHWPILAFARSLLGPDLGIAQTLAAVALAGLAAALSYRFVERPFLGRSLGQLPFLRIGGWAMALTTAGCLAIIGLHGLPGRYGHAVLAAFDAANDFNHARGRCHNGGGAPIPYAQNCIFGADGVTPDTAVWGDSHGAELVVALGNDAKAVGRAVMQITASACPPVLSFAPAARPHCQEHNAATAAGLAADAAIRTVILAVNPAAYDLSAAFRAGYEDAVRRLVDSGKHVILLLPIPVMEEDPPSAVGLALARGRDPAALGRPAAEYHRRNAAWRQFLTGLAARYGVDSYDPAERLCRDGLCHIFDARAGVLYFNRDHLSVAGAAFMSADLGSRLYGAVPATVAGM